MSIKVCPKCNKGKVYVTDSRESTGNRCRRRYACECGYKFTSIEEIVDIGSEKLVKKITDKRRRKIAELIIKQRTHLDKYLEELRGLE